MVHDVKWKICLSDGVLTVCMIYSCMRVNMHDATIMCYNRKAMYSCVFKPYLSQGYKSQCGCVDLLLFQEKSKLQDELQAATSFNERDSIQHRLEEVDRKLQSNKTWMPVWEDCANHEEEELKQLESTITEEGL